MICLCLYGIYINCGHMLHKFCSATTPPTNRRAFARNAIVQPSLRWRRRAVFTFAALRFGRCAALQRQRKTHTETYITCLCLCVGTAQAQLTLRTLSLLAVAADCWPSDPMKRWINKKRLFSVRPRVSSVWVRTSLSSRSAVELVGILWPLLCSCIL